MPDLKNLKKKKKSVNNNKKLNSVTDQLNGSPERILT